MESIYLHPTLGSQETSLQTLGDEKETWRGILRLAFLYVLIYTRCVYDYNIFDHQPCELAFICFCINLATSTATSSEVLLTVSRQSWKGTISNLHTILTELRTLASRLGSSLNRHPTFPSVDMCRTPAPTMLFGFGSTSGRRFKP